MQPTSQPPQHQQYYGPPQQQYPPAQTADPGRAAGWPPPGAGPWSAPQTAATTLKTARPWSVAIVAFLTLLILIAGLGNQWVTDAINRHAVNARRFGDNAARAATSYQWRFSPRGGQDFAHIWLGNLALIGSALVLTLLLVAVVARGRGGFGQAFIGAWMAVVVASMLATYVRVLVVDTAKVGDPGLSKANAVFSQFAAGPFVLAASLGFGLVVALVAGLTSVLIRRTEVISAPARVVHGGPPPQFPQHGESPQPPQPSESRQPSESPQSRQPWESPQPGLAPVAEEHPWAAEPASETSDDAGRVGSPPGGTEHTAILPAVDHPRPGGDPSTETTQLPRGVGGPTEAGGEPTTALPRAEDDQRPPL